MKKKRTVIVWIEPGNCKPTGFYLSWPKAAKGMGLHVMTIRKQLKEQGYYSGKKGYLYAIEQI